MGFINFNFVILYIKNSYKNSKYCSFNRLLKATYKWIYYFYMKNKIIKVLKSYVILNTLIPSHIYCVMSTMPLHWVLKPACYTNVIIFALFL